MSLFTPFLLLILICFLCLLRAPLAPAHIPLQCLGLLHPLPTFFSTAISMLLVCARPNVNTQKALAQHNMMPFSQLVKHASYCSGRNSLNSFSRTPFTMESTIVTGSVTMGKSICPVIIMWRIFRLPRHHSRNTIQNRSAKPTAVSVRKRLGSHCSHPGRRSFMFQRLPLVPLAMGGGGGQLVVSFPHCVYNVIKAYTHGR